MRAGLRLGIVLAAASLALGAAPALAQCGAATANSAREQFGRPARSPELQPWRHRDPRGPVADRASATATRARGAGPKRAGNDCIATETPRPRRGRGHHGANRFARHPAPRPAEAVVAACRGVGGPSAVATATSARAAIRRPRRVFEPPPPESSPAQSGARAQADVVAMAAGRARARRRRRRSCCAQPRPRGLCRRAASLTSSSRPSPRQGRFPGPRRNQRRRRRPQPRVRRPSRAFRAWSPPGCARGSISGSIRSVLSSKTTR